MAQIEHIDAVQSLDEIFQFPGLDAYIIGPYDLSSSMGLSGQLDHPSVKAAVTEIEIKGRQYRIPGGIHIVEPSIVELQAAVSRDFKFIAYSVDFRMLDVMCRVGIDAIKGRR